MTRLIVYRYGKRVEFEYPTTKEAITAAIHMSDNGDAYPYQVVGENGNNIWDHNCGEILENVT